MSYGGPHLFSAHTIKEHFKNVLSDAKQIETKNEITQLNR